MLRFLFLLLLFYFGYRFYKKYLSAPSPKEKVKGRNRKKPLDLRDSEVEDAHFEDVNDDRE